MINEAIYELYPSARLIEKMDGVYSVYDGVRNPLVIDMTAVNQEAGRLQAEAQAQQEERETLRQSMITKLAATLTPEETALLEELL